MNTLEAARSYVARGFSVIPIRANGKRPAEDWEQYQHTLPTGEQLTEWFDTTDLNIGIVTGAVSGIYVIDVDTYKGTDHVPYPTELVGQSANGGMHYFYKLGDEEVRNKQGVLEHVDVRGEGGYVVAYPSRIVDSDSGEVKEYKWLSSGNPAKMPARVLSQYLTTKTFDQPLPSDESLGLLSKVLNSGYTEGQHNEELYTLARLFGRAGHNPNLQRKVAEEILQWLESQDSTPQEGFDATVASAWEYEAGRLETTEPVTQREIRPMSFKEMGNFKPPATMFEDGQAIHENTLALIVGQRNNGKTLFLQHVGLGSAANGYKVCYVMTEDSPYFFYRRMQQWQEHHNTAINSDNFTVWRAMEGLIWQLTNIDHVWELINNMKPHKPDMIILDPLIEFALGADEQSAQTMGLVMSHIQLIKRELNCTVVVAHHAGKDATRGARGSSAIEGSPDTVILIKQNPVSGDVTAICTKERNGSKPAPSVYLVTKSEDGLGAALSRANSLEEVVLASNENDNVILQAVLKAGVPVTAADVVHMTGLPQATVYRRLTKLVEIGKLIKDEALYLYNESDD